MAQTCSLYQSSSPQHPREHERSPWASLLDSAKVVPRSKLFLFKRSESPSQLEPSESHTKLLRVAERECLRSLLGGEKTQSWGSGGLPPADFTPSFPVILKPTTGKEQSFLIPKLPATNTSPFVFIRDTKIKTVESTVALGHTAASVTHLGRTLSDAGASHVEGDVQAPLSSAADTSGSRAQ